MDRRSLVIPSLGPVKIILSLPAPGFVSSRLEPDKERGKARRGHSGTEGGRTCVTYFAEEGVFF